MIVSCLRSAGARLSLVLLLSVSLFAAAVEAHAAPEVGDDNTKGIKGTNRVLIGEFGVEFQTSIHMRASSGGANAAAKSELVGVSDELMQAITEQAYADTVAALMAAGFEVVPQAEVLAHPIHQELAEKYGEPAPYLFSDNSFIKTSPVISKIFAPAGMKAYLSSSGKRGSYRQTIDVQNSQRSNKEQELAKSLDATVLNINYLASFGQGAATSKKSVMAAFAGVAKASFTAVPNLVPNDTQIQFITKSGMRAITSSKRIRHTGAVYLEEALLSSDSGVLELVDTTTDASRAGDSAYKLISGALGGNGSQNRSASVTKVTSEEAFRNTYQALIGEAATAMVGALAQHR